MSLTVERVQAAINWEYVQDGYYAKGVVGNIDDDPIVWISGNGWCEHDPCHETHETLYVFEIGGQHFARSAEFSSFSGTQWLGDLFPVRRRDRIVQEWVV